jgi:mRNA interferase RelE/StbE
MKTVTYTDAALKMLEKLDARIEAQIRQKVAAFAADWRTVAGSIKRLKGSPYVRLRVGDYRVIIDEQTMMVIVVKIGHRSDVYR